MKILVTGGKGIVGTQLVEALKLKGHEVWVCDTRHSNEERYLRCDVSKYRNMLEIFENNSFDYVYHLAAEFGRWNGEDFYEDLWMTNAVGTKNMLRLQKKFGYRMVFSSSSEVYGDYEGIMYEDVMDKLEIKQMNDYAITKWVNEMQIMNSALMDNTETVRVRLFNTYGPGEYYTPYRSAICIFAYKALHNLPYTVYKGHKRTSLYIKDCAAMLAEIVDKFKPGEVYNIAGTELHDMKTASDMILDYLGKDSSLVNYVDHEPFTTTIKKPDISKTIKDLGFKPEVTLEKGIPETIEWMKKVYNV